MNSCDFEYDGYCLSDYGFVICSFDAAGGAVTKTGGDITFHQVPMNRGRVHNLTDAAYDSCIEATFDICKDPDANDDPEISMEEFRTLSRWLARSVFRPMRFIYDDESFVCWFNAGFNISKITIGGELYGLNLRMITDSPFGHGPLFTAEYDVESDEVFVVKDHNDEVGDSHPTLSIVCGESGDLTITNVTTGDETVIGGCSVGETITIDGEHQIILSDIAAHKIYNDFNFVFPRLMNTLISRENEFTSSLSCTVTVSYYPVIRDIPA